MRKVLARLAVQADQINPYVGTAVLESLRAKLASLPSGEKPMLRFKLLVDVGFHELRLGENEAAVGHYEEARALVPALGDKLGAAEIDKVDFDTAIAWLRLGETQNCVARHTSESCILPIGPGGVHVDQEGSRRSIALLEALLERNPTHFGARWILNIAHMTVGTYPEGVPERLPPAERLLRLRSRVPALRGGRRRARSRHLQHGRRGAGRRLRRRRRAGHRRPRAGACETTT